MHRIDHITIAIVVSWGAVTAVAGCQPAPAVPPSSVADAVDAEAFLDPLVTDAAHYALEFENEYVRVLREKLPTGAEGAMHSHRDRVSVYLNDGDVTIMPRGGEPVEAALVANSTSWGAATTHGAVTRSDLENLSIELTDRGGGEVPAPEPDAVVVDAEHHVVDFENERVRVVRMTYPAGFTTPLHAHRAGFGVFLTDALGQNILEEGEPVPIQAAARSTFWTTGQPVHVTENLGETDLVVVLVEVKRGPSTAVMP